MDDTMRIGPSIVQETHSLKEGLDTFLEASRLEINKNKS